MSQGSPAYNASKHTFFDTQFTQTLHKTARFGTVAAVLGKEDTAQAEVYPVVACVLTSLVESQYGFDAALLRLACISL